jgi:hypothetical protein
MRHPWHGHICQSCFQLVQTFVDGVDLELDAAYRDTEVVHPFGDTELYLLVGC